VEVAASRDNHAAFAALKKVVFGAAEARHAAAAFAVSTWCRAPVAVVVAVSIHLAMMASFGATAFATSAAAAASAAAASAGASSVVDATAAATVRGLGGYLQRLTGFTVGRCTLS
jgi:hypothetical protein